MKDCDLMPSRHQMPHNVWANKLGAANDQNAHHFSFGLRSSHLKAILGSTFVLNVTIAVR
jgi:hypothetical protein